VTSGGAGWWEISSFRDGAAFPQSRVQACFLGALDLSDFPVVNNDLDNTETKALNLASDDFQPLWNRSGGVGFGDRGGHKVDLLSRNLKHTSIAGIKSKGFFLTF
jgi:hypothetical protein